MSIKVLGAGLGRTGTYSLKLALEILGYGKCYHMFELLKNRSDISYWENLENKEFVDYDLLFDNYQSAVDYPGCCYIEELIKYYPKAKVILTIRDFESWHASAIATILTINPTTIQKVGIVLKQPFSKKAQDLARIGDYLNQIIDRRMLDVNQARRIFDEHNMAIKELVPSENLLIYEVKDGWTSLCNFLKLEVPAIDFPHLNKRDNFSKKIQPLLW